MELPNISEIFSFAGYMIYFLGSYLMYNQNMSKYKYIFFSICGSFMLLLSGYFGNNRSAILCEIIWSSQCIYNYTQRKKNEKINLL